ncbi:MAG: hypothetical protein IKW13_01750 [Thermoguttaceae bacterium]|nr:hypothetical protein [Thermoguttaceae bacterium]
MTHNPSHTSVKRRIFFVSFSVLIVIYFFFTFLYPASPAQFVETPGEVASTEFVVTVNSQNGVDEATNSLQTLPASSDAQPPFRVTVELFPNVIRFGDPVYIVAYLENISPTPQTFASYHTTREVNDPICFSITSNEIPDEEARCYFEKQYPVDVFIIPPLVTLAPGERALWQRCVVELPPLEDFDEPFYSALEKKLAQTSVSCDLNVKSTVYVRHMKPINGEESFDCRVEGRLPVVVKPRPENETALLRRWLSKTKRCNLLPRVVRGNKVAWQANGSENPAILTNYLWFDFFPFSPWDFIRPGNRKPSTPNNPITVDGWRKLDAEFAPSTLRDEITLTRLQLEYYDADEGEASDAALKTLVEWLSQRPEPQRVVLSQSLLSKRAKFKGTPLEAKNATLCDALTSAFPVEMTKSDDAM